jgi:hypothetical protein
LLDTFRIITCICDDNLISVPVIHSGFGDLVVSMLPKIAGSNPAEAVGFFPGIKNPEHAFLQKGSKAVGPVSYIYGTLKIPCGFRGSRDRQGQISRPFLARRFPPSLIEGSVLVQAVRGFPCEGEGRTLGVVRGHRPRDGRTLGAVRGPPLRRRRGLGRYGCPWR